MTRDELLAIVDAEWRRLDQTVRALSPNELARPVFTDEAAPDPWTIGFVVFHLAEWKRNAVRVAALLEAGSPPMGGFPAQILGIDVAEFNSASFNAWRSREPDVLTEHHAAHHELVAAVSRLPEEHLLTDDDRPRAWLTPALGHSEFHRRKHIEGVVEREAL
jgi:Mycothiol maleylpyruvate isomerase N-terminal domain